MGNSSITPSLRATTFRRLDHGDFQVCDPATNGVFAPFVGRKRGAPEKRRPLSLRRPTKRPSNLVASIETGWRLALKETGKRLRCHLKPTPVTTDLEWHIDLPICCR